MIACRRAAAFILAASLAGPVAAQQAEEKPPTPTRAAVADFASRLEGAALSVSYRITGVLSPELLERIESGITVTFRHRMEVLVRRGFPLWTLRTVARVRIETSVTYDSLTRQYTLGRRTRSYAGGEMIGEPLEEEITSSSAEEMRAWMTELDEAPPLDLAGLSAEASARIRVESIVGRRWWLLVPTRRTVSAERKLER